MSSLKRNLSDHPGSVSQPSVAKHILRRNSSKRREPLRRNSSGKGDGYSTAPRLASMLKRNIDNSGDPITSKCPSVKSPPVSSQLQNTSHSSLVYRSHQVPSTNFDHTFMPENEGKKDINLSREVRLSCPNEETAENHKSLFLDSNDETEDPPACTLESDEEIEETPKSILLESSEETEKPHENTLAETDGAIEETTKYILLESNDETEETFTATPINHPVASPRKLTAISTALPVNDLPPSSSTLQPSSPVQTHQPSPNTLRKHTDETKDLTEKPPDSSRVAYKVCFPKLHCNHVG